MTKFSQTFQDILESQSQLIASPLDIEEVVSAANRILRSAEIQSVSRSLAYIGGSYTEGLANASSDLDIYVIFHEESIERRRPPSINRSDEETKLRVDVEFWGSARVDRVVSRLRDMRIGEDRLTGILDGSEERFVHRALNGQVLENPNGFKRLQQYLEGALFSRYLVEKNVSIIHEVAEDLWGCLDSRDLVTTISRCRNLVEHAVDAYAASRGYTNPSPKWRNRQLLSMLSHGDISSNTTERALFYLLQAEPINSIVQDFSLYADNAFELANRLVSAAEHSLEE